MNRLGITCFLCRVRLADTAQNARIDRVRVGNVTTSGRVDRALRSNALFASIAVFVSNDLHVLMRIAYAILSSDAPRGMFSYITRVRGSTS